MTQLGAEEWKIEKARAEDWFAIRGICCETSPSAARMTPGWRDFFGEFWVGPYQKLLPQWTWVARPPGASGVVGYLTGAPESLGFERLRRWKHRLPLLAELALCRHEWNPDARRWLRRALRFDVNPEKCFGAEVQRELRALYPAHLHTNLAPQAQGKGAGRLLMSAFVVALQKEGVPGVHLFCGKAPVGFYQKQGFGVRARTVLGSSGAEVFVMTRSLSAGRV